MDGCPRGALGGIRGRPGGVQGGPRGGPGGEKAPKMRSKTVQKVGGKTARKKEASGRGKGGGRGSPRGGVWQTPPRVTRVLGGGLGEASGTILDRFWLSFRRLLASQKGTKPGPPLNASHCGMHPCMDASVSGPDGVRDRFGTNSLTPPTCGEEPCGGISTLWDSKR